MANDEEPVEKALMASSSVAVTSEDSASSNLATLMAPAESLPGKLREPLSGGASTPLSGRSRRLSWFCRQSPLHPRTAPTVTSPSLWHKRNLCPVRYGKLGQGEHERLCHEEHERRVEGERRPKQRDLRRLRNNRIHRPNVVTRCAAAELTGAVTRYRGVPPNNKKNNDDNNINSNNHAGLAECFQPSTLHKLRQPGIYTNMDTPDDNDINNNNHAALAERFQPSTLHKLRQLDIYTNTDTTDDNGINNNNHAALADRCQPSTLHKVLQLGRYTDTDTPDTAHQLDAEAIPAEVAYTRTNTQPSCSGGR